LLWVRGKDPYGSELLGKKKSDRKKMQSKLGLGLAQKPL
jgi:hypothetical protein